MTGMCDGLLIKPNDYFAAESGSTSYEVIYGCKLAKTGHMTFELNGVIRRPMEGHRPSISLTRLQVIYSTWIKRRIE
jgi:hypothetical protein